MTAVHLGLTALDVKMPIKTAGLTTDKVTSTVTDILTIGKFPLTAMGIPTGITTALIAAIVNLILPLAMNFPTYQVNTKTGMETGTATTIPIRYTEIFAPLIGAALTLTEMDVLTRMEMVQATLPIQAPHWNGMNPWGPTCGLLTQHRCLRYQRHRPRLNLVR